MKTLMMVAVAGLASVSQPTKDICQDAPESKLVRAYADVEQDLDVRRNELGLLGSAPLFKMEVASPKVAQDSSSSQDAASAEGR
jgi:hypothetical protein